MSHTPILGQQYGVLCPVCFNYIVFTCEGSSSYGTLCTVCGARIDLRNPSEALQDGDVGSFTDDRPVLYAAGVEVASGATATAQVHVLMDEIAEEQKKLIPTRVTGQTIEAFSAQRNQRMAEKFYLFFPITYAIEYLVFGRVPAARLGHVRIFRKYIPLFGYVNIPVPRTSTSYAFPSFITASLFSLYTYFCFYVVSVEWLVPAYQVECVAVAFFYLLMFKLVYTDPGYVLPAYLDNSDRAADITLKDVESNQRQSLWESVDGILMERKWCSTCDMYRPLRAAHCYLCDLCVLDHDHHCAVIGTCVGRRKLEMFTAFVLVTQVALWLPTVTVAHSAFVYWATFGSWEKFVSVSLFILYASFGTALAFVAVSMVISLASETTTRERIQSVYAEKRNPFHRGVLRNLWFHLWARRVSPSILTDEVVKKASQRSNKSTDALLPEGNRKSAG